MLPPRSRVSPSASQSSITETPAIEARSNRAGKPGAVELAAVWLFCLAMTLGPVLFLLAANG